MIVDHRSMWRKTQIPTYIVSWLYVKVSLYQFMWTKCMPCVFLNGFSLFFVPSLFQLLYQWTWVTLGSGIHKTPRSLKPFPLFLISQFCPPFYIWDLFTLISLLSANKDPQAGRFGHISPESFSFLCLSDLRSGLTGWHLFIRYIFKSRLSGHSPFSCSSGLWSLFFFKVTKTCFRICFLTPWVRV